MALTDEGRVVAWGSNWSGKTAMPSGLSNVVAIAERRNHSMALTAEGRVVVWGLERRRPGDRAQRLAQCGGDRSGRSTQSGAERFATRLGRACLGRPAISGGHSR